MSRIEKLTDEQIARFPEFVEKWTRIGLCTDPADRPEAERGIALAYRAARLEPPRKIVWCMSPLSNALTKHFFSNIKTNSVGASVRASVGDSIWASVGASVWASVGDSIWASVGDSVWGQHDAGWLSFCDFFSIVCGLKKETEKLSGLETIAKSAGWFIPYKSVCFVSERHNAVKQDGEWRLHCLDGPALTYPDGFSIYAVHGVRVPPDVIEKQKEITSDKILAEKNQEVRRVMIDLFGAERFISELGAKIVAQDPFGVLYIKEFDDAEPICLVKVKNSTPEPDGTRKDYFLWVDSQLRPLPEKANMSLGEPQELTARNAVASTFGMRGEEYCPLVET